MGSYSYTLKMQKSHTILTTGNFKQLVDVEIIPDPGGCFEIGVCQTVRILSGIDLDLSETLKFLHCSERSKGFWLERLGPAHKFVGFSDFKFTI